MTEKKLELRMYGLVPYNISPIQQGIQYGHSKDEYTLKMFEMLDVIALEGMSKFDKNSIEVYTNYRDWLKNWKTYIILNGGTTNNNPERLGSLNEHLQTLKDNGIYCTEFYEPDLGDQLTGVDFLVDERVFGKNADGTYVIPDFDVMANLNSKTPITYDKWVENIGGPKNAFLRDFLKNFRLA